MILHSHTIHVWEGKKYTKYNTLYILDPVTGALYSFFRNFDTTENVKISEKGVQRPSCSSGSTTGGKDTPCQIQCITYTIIPIHWRLICPNNTTITSYIPLCIRIVDDCIHNSQSSQTHYLCRLLAATQQSRRHFCTNHHNNKTVFKSLPYLKRSVPHISWFPPWDSSRVFGWS